MMSAASSQQKQLDLNLDASPKSSSNNCGATHPTNQGTGGDAVGSRRNIISSNDSSHSSVKSNTYVPNARSFAANLCSTSAGHNVPTPKATTTTASTTMTITTATSTLTQPSSSYNSATTATTSSNQISNIDSNVRTYVVESLDTIAPATMASMSDLINTSSAMASTTNGSFSDSLPSTTDGHRTPNHENLSRTNLYIRGLPASTSDQDLYNMCVRFGNISSTKAILDKLTGFCRGYGFVQFTAPQSAEVAVQELTKTGVQAQMARISPVYSPHNHHHPHHHHLQNNQQLHHHHHGSNSHSGNHNSNAQQHNHNSSNSNNNNNQNNADPTNLYIANLPADMSEQELENLLSAYGPVVSTRILRDQSNNPRGVGFARMESRDKCQEIIEKLNGKPCKGSKEPLLIKFADGGNKKRHHHNNNHHMQHHKMHQDDNRWRENSNTTGDLSNLSSFEQQGNIAHINQLSDLAMISTLSYPRMQATFPPTVGPSGPYPTAMGPQTSAPQWIHPGGPGQPWNVIPQQMLQAGNLPPSNQAPSATFPYGHMSQLTSQMQGMQIAHHPTASVGGYHIPPQHQWSAMWPHPMAPQQPQPSSMRLAAPMPPLPQQQLSPQDPPQPLSGGQELPPSQQKSETKVQVSTPL